MLNTKINELLQFALDKNLINREDLVWAANSLIGELKVHDFKFEDVRSISETSPDGILSEILDYAAENNLIENTETERDLLDTKLMGLLTPKPSDVINEFNAKYKNSPVEATDYFYKLGVSSNYIRSARTAKNICWKTDTEFGALDITINLSKPEKDPRDIAKAKNAPSTGYPKCLLCRENEGFYGHHGHPARQNIRLIPLDLCGRDWFFQYSPYSYYNEHCIVLDKNHVPMLISRETFENLLAFVEKFPHYFLGSNADLPIVGGSILSHDHYQGGRYIFAMNTAEFEKFYDTHNDKITAGRIKWPMSAIRLKSNEPELLIDYACKILDAWRNWTDESVNVLAYSDNEPHNTITPIARFNDNNKKFELDLVLRNNRTSEEHPLGIFHPHANVHHIKKENIGLIEVMGLAVLPARLKKSLEQIAELWLNGAEVLPEELSQHNNWYREIKAKHGNLKDSVVIKNTLRDEVGHVFSQVLKDSGVFKRDNSGFAAFDKFAESVIK